MIVNGYRGYGADTASTVTDWVGVIQKLVGGVGGGEQQYAPPQIITKTEVPGWVYLTIPLALGGLGVAAYMARRRK